MKMKKIFQILLVILLLTLAGGAGYFVGAGSHPYPDELIEFHLNSSQHTIFKISAYVHPYRNSFWYALLLDDGSLQSMSISGYDKAFGSTAKPVNGTATEQEIKNVRSLFHEMIDDGYPAFQLASLQPGDQIVTLQAQMSSDNQSGRFHVMTCRADACPKEICTIFDLVKDIAERSDGRGPILCPIP